MKLQNAKLTVALMTIGGLAALAAIAFFLFLPALRDARDLKQRIVSAQTELEAQYANRKNLLSSRAKVVETKEIMKTLSAQFLRPGRELDFITGLETLASKNEVVERLQLFKNESERAAPEFDNRFDLTIDGPYAAAFQMLIDLEKFETLMVVDSLTIRPGGGSDGPSTLTIDLHGSIPSPPKGLL